LRLPKKAQSQLRTVALSDMKNTEDSREALSPSSFIINRNKCCCICGASGLPSVLSLPQLPLTGRFVRQPKNDFIAGIDQELLLCENCNHVQLMNQVDPDTLYDSSYSFKTSLSATARQGTSAFIDFLDEVKGDRKFNCILDVGCNDLFLINELKGYGKWRVGIDPIWASQDLKSDDPDILVIGDSVEGADLEAIMPAKPDLIVCRHTLEHIFNPRLVIEKILKNSTDDSLFVFEIPCFDYLLERNRIDQVFHEHLQYFTQGSLAKLIDIYDAEVIRFSSNYHNWGALMVAFKKKEASKKVFDENYSMVTAEQIEQKYKLFSLQMENTINVLTSLTGNIYGYGAALMLPVLAYHMKTDLGILNAVLDDDEEKDEWFYDNLPLRVCRPQKINDYKDSSIFLTAWDNVKPIMSKLLADRPKHIIFPLHLI
jgi:hypothetical protein